MPFCCPHLHSRYILAMEHSMTVISTFTPSAYLYERDLSLRNCSNGTEFLVMLLTLCAGLKQASRSVTSSLRLVPRWM